MYFTENRVITLTKKSLCKGDEKLVEKKCGKIGSTGGIAEVVFLIYKFWKKRKT